MLIHSRRTLTSALFWLFSALGARPSSLIIAFGAHPSSLFAQRTFGGAPQLQPGDSTTLVILGTGTPGSNPERSGPATAVVVGTRVFLFDAGPGVQRRLAAAGLPIDGVTALFLTHLHSDHTLGLPDLIFSSWVMGRKKPFPLIGPPGTKAMSDHLEAAWSEDEDIRVNGLEHNTANGWKVTVRETRGGVVFDSGGVKVTAIPVPHGSWKFAFGYRIDTPTRSIVISGDTRYSPDLANAARGADVLVHEVYVETRLAPEQRTGGEAWPNYMKSFHTSDTEVGRVAAMAKPKLLILHHIVGAFTTEELLAGVKKGGFNGRVVVAKDLDKY